MDEHETGQPPTQRMRRPRHLKVLIGALIAVFVVGLLDLGLSGWLEGIGDWPDACLTRDGVLNYLDGKKAHRFARMDEARGKIPTITLRKDRISSLVIRNGHPGVSVQFFYDNAGERLRIDGSFTFGHSDSRDLHQHEWGDFSGEVVEYR